MEPNFRNIFLYRKPLSRVAYIEALKYSSQENLDLLLQIMGYEHDLDSEYLICRESG